MVGTLGKADGFNKASDVHIPLSESLRKVQSMLSKFGVSSLVDDLELKLNRAAEAAIPKVKILFGANRGDLCIIQSLFRVLRL